MITYTQLGNFGRLGNQLFQYAALRSVSLETGYAMKIPSPENIICQNQECQLTKFNIECDYLTEKDYQSLKFRFMEPHHAAFWPQIFQVGDDTDLFGYFQNYQYFAKQEATIRADLTLEKELDEYASDYIGNLTKGNESIVSVHIRRGDNTDGTGGIVSDYYGKGDVLNRNSIFGTYFYRVLDGLTDQNLKFLVFSGGSQQGMKHNQSDIDWCRENIKDDRFIFCEGHTDMQDFAIMKNCHHNIISHSTSFGYWAALLNENPNKTVIAPANYAIPDDGRVQRGFYPPTWNVV